MDVDTVHLLQALPADLPEWPWQLSVSESSLMQLVEGIADKFSYPQSVTLAEVHNCAMSGRTGRSRN